jgi:hypothetical protein
MVGFLQKRLPGRRNHRLSIAVLTVFLILAAAVCAEVFVFTNLDHAHTGEHCSVCLQIKTAGLLKGAGCICFFALAACLIPQTFVIAKSRLCFSVVPETLVELKIKYNS